MWQGSAFLLSVSAMMNAGVKVDEVSLNRISKNSDPYLAQRIRGVKRWIISGHNLGEALHQSGYNFPDPEIISDLRIYARLRGFDKNLVRITRAWVEDLVERVAVIMKVLNTVVLFLIAIVIGMLISSLYSVVQQIQSQT
jgi:type II secretory pathway component PulF